MKEYKIRVKNEIVTVNVIVNENPAKKGKKIHHFWIKKLLTSF